MWVPAQAQCLLPTEVGPCRALIPRFTYNPATDTCESFFYGGCDGNANNFVTVEECQDACVVEGPLPSSGRCPFPQPPLDPDTDICTLRRVTGPCRAAIPKWGYDPRSRGCVEFIYGGCCGNPNRFDTKEECELVCA